MKKILHHNIRSKIVFAHIIAAKLALIKSILFSFLTVKTLIIESAFLAWFFHFIPHITLASTTYDYAISTIVNPAVAVWSEEVTLMHFYSNTEDDTSPDRLTVRSILPNTVQINSANYPYTTTANGDNNIYTFTVSGAQGTIVLDVQAETNEYGYMPNIAQVVIPDGDPDESNNTYQSSFIVVTSSDTQADLYVADDNTPSQIGILQSYNASIVFANNGPDPAYGVEMYLIADEGLSNMSFDPDPFYVSGNVIGWFFEEMNNGQYEQIDISATVEPIFTQGDQIVNYVSIQSPIDDPSSWNNSQMLTTTVSSWVPSLIVDPIVEADTICENDIVEVQLNYENMSNTTQSDVYIDIDLVSQIGLYNASVQPTSSNGNTYTWQFDEDLSAGEAWFLKIYLNAHTVANMTLVASIGTATDVQSSSQFTIDVEDCSSNNGWWNSGWGSNGGNSSSNTLGSRWWLPQTQTIVESPTQQIVSEQQHTSANTKPNIACATEALAAYEYAFSKGITTMPDIYRARVCDEVIRMELAKMMTNFAVNVLKRNPDINRVCSFSDMQDQSKEMQQYAVLACQLWLMWLEYDGTPAKKFMPTDKVNRAQFGTAFSRLIYGNKYNGNAEYWYMPHLYALKKDGVMNYIADPWMYELRSFIMIVMMRSDQNGLLSNQTLSSP